MGGAVVTIGAVSGGEEYTTTPGLPFPPPEPPGPPEPGSMALLVVGSVAMMRRRCVMREWQV